jgi:hypothetical protein
MEFVNAHIGSVNMPTPVMFERLNTKINTMLGSHILYDSDVRDLYVMMEEFGLRDQWKEMNAKIRAELEGITKHVEEANKILEANPPEPEFRLVHAGRYAAPVAWANYATLPQQWATRYTAVEEKPVRFGLEKPELVSMPWAQWNIAVNRNVADANVKDIIPEKKQVIVRRMFGEWDALMEDVAAWHQWGLGYNVRLAYPYAVHQQQAAVVHPGFTQFAHPVAHPGYTYKVTYSKKE